MKRRRLSLAAALLAAAVTAGCASGASKTAYHDDGEGRLFTLDEFERHIAEHVRAAAAAGENLSDEALDAHAVAIAKANALARLARAYMSLSGRAAVRVTPPPAALGNVACYSHSGRRVGACLDI